MIPRIPHRRLLRLAARRLPAVQQQRHSLSTSLTRRQGPKPEAAVPETSSPSPPTPIATSDPTAPTTLPPPPPPPPPSPTAADPHSAPPPPPKKKFRIIPTFVFASTFLLLGYVGGTALRLFISPPAPPVPGSPEDKFLTITLHEQAAKLPLVKRLAADPAWESWDAYSSLSEQHKKQHIAAGALQGSRGVGGFQRIFHNKTTGELVSVIFFGPSTIGWPGVVHGGCLATILDESCGRAAFKEWGGLPGVTASLSINYKAATLANGFYLVRVKPRAEEDLPAGEKGKRHYKVYVDATIEDPVSGKVNVAAEALFVGGSKNKKGGLLSKVGDAGGEAHARF